jgi:phosphoglycolate phosphatase
VKLVIFDVDGTLVDSQAIIVESMAAGFAAAGLPDPGRAAALSIVGLSLPVAMARLAPGADAAQLAVLSDGYRAAYHQRLALSGSAASAPLFPGARAAIDRLDGPGRLLAVATGKGRRGLDSLLEAHGLTGVFVTTKTADDAPSRPHPGMLHAILAETGVDAADAVMVGDTTFDMEMAVAAGVRALGVSWGYHRPETLRAVGAHAIIDSFDAIDAALEPA